MEELEVKVFGQDQPNITWVTVFFAVLIGVPTMVGFVWINILLAGQQY